VTGPTVALTERSAKLERLGRTEQSSEPLQPSERKICHSAGSSAIDTVG